jgi:predicted nucleotidyltransferase
MTQEDILTEIKTDLPILKENFGVNRIGLFGSYSRGGDTSESDIDILVDLNPPYAKHYFDLLFYLEKKLGKKVDLVRRGEHLREKFIRNIEEDIIYV